MFRTTNQSQFYYLVRYILILGILVCDSSVFGQEPTNIFTAEMISARLDSISNSSSLSDAAKTQAVQYYEQARDSLALKKGWNAKIQEYQSDIDNAASNLADVEKEIQELSAPPVADFSNRELPELEQELLQADAEMVILRSDLTYLQNEPNRRSERRRSIPEQLSATRGKLAEIEQLRNTTRANDEPEELTAARNVALDVRQQNRQAEVRAYELELQSYEVRSQILPLRITLASRKVSNQEQRIAALNQIIEVKRNQELRDTAAKSREIIENLGQFPVPIREHLAAMLATNTAFSEQRAGTDGTLATISHLDRSLSELSRSLAELVDKRSRAERSGTNTTSGRILRLRGESLPRTKTYERSIRQHNILIADAELEQLLIGDEWIALADVNAAVDAELDRLGVGPDFENLEELRGILVQTLTARQKTLGDLRSDYDEYILKLDQLVATEKDYIQAVEDFRSFIAERVLFIRSGSWPGPKDITITLDAFRWLFDAPQWVSTLRSAWNGLRQAGTSYVLGAIAILVLVLMRPRILTSIKTAGEEASKKSCTSIEWTARAFLSSLLFSLAIPLALYFCGKAFVDGFPETTLNTPLGSSLISVSMLIAPLLFFRAVLLQDGIAQKHYGWPTDLTDAVRRHIMLLIPVLVTLLFLITVFEYSSNDDWRETAGRLSFLVAMPVLGYTSIRFCRGERSILFRLLTQLNLSGRPLLGKSLKLLMMGIPLALFFSSLGGYYYTALRFGTNFYLTFLLFTGATLAAGFANRWVQLTRRRLAREQAQQKRKQLKKQLGNDFEEGAAPEEEVLDLKAVDEQTGRLIRAATVSGILVGIFLIWADMVPALEVLNRIEIGHTTQVITESATEGDTESIGVEKTISVPVTLLNLVTAIFVIAVTIAAAKNVPGLLELSVLQRLRLAAGERYAITSIVRYAIGSIGVVIAFNSIGLGWVGDESNGWSQR